MICPFLFSHFLRKNSRFVDLLHLERNLMNDKLGKSMIVRAGHVLVHTAKNICHRCSIILKDAYFSPPSSQSPL